MDDTSGDADPAPVWSPDDFLNAPRYVRLHGKPKIYYSSDTREEISSFSKRLAFDSWCVFDNTASGAAIQNALTMLEKQPDLLPMGEGRLPHKPTSPNGTM